MLSIGQRVHTLRLEKGVTQAELAEGSRVSQARISEIEKGKRDMTMSTFLTLCAALGIEPSNFFIRSGRQVRKELLTRSRLERIARAVWDTSLAKSQNEKITAELLGGVVCLGGKQRSKKDIYADWSSLRNLYSETEIATLAERVRGERYRRHA